MTSAFITGGGDGIGKGLALNLAKNRVCKNFSIVDLDLHKAEDVAREINAIPGCRACAIQCDVTSEEDQNRAFSSHARAFDGHLDLCVLNAGIMESGEFISDPNDTSWKRTLDVNLIAVMVGVRLASHLMITTAQNNNNNNVILITASASGFFPMPLAPVYSTSKAGCVMLTRSLAPRLWSRHRIRLVALCPQFTDTPLVRNVRRLQGDAVADEMTKDVRGRLLTVERVAEVGAKLMCDQSLVGECALVLANGDVVKVQPLKVQRLGEYINTY